MAHILDPETFIIGWNNFLEQGYILGTLAHYSTSIWIQNAYVVTLQIESEFSKTIV